MKPLEIYRNLFQPKKVFQVTMYTQLHFAEINSLFAVIDNFERTNQYHRTPIVANVVFSD